MPRSITTPPTISIAPDFLDVFWLRWILFDLLADAADVDVDDLEIAHVVVAPDVVEDLLAICGSLAGICD